MLKRILRPVMGIFLLISLFLLLRGLFFSRNTNEYPIKEIRVCNFNEPALYTAWMPTIAEYKTDSLVLQTKERNELQIGQDFEIIRTSEPIVFNTRFALSNIEGGDYLLVNTDDRLMRLSEDGELTNQHFNCSLEIPENSSKFSSHLDSVMQLFNGLDNKWVLTNAVETVSTYLRFEASPNSYYSVFSQGEYRENYFENTPFETQINILSFDDLEQADKYYSTAYSIMGKNFASVERPILSVESSEYDNFCFENKNGGCYFIGRSNNLVIEIIITWADDNPTASLNTSKYWTDFAPTVWKNSIESYEFLFKN